MFELDFSEKERGLATSKEDREFLKKVENGIVHCDDSHYEIPLPLKGENNITLPHNRPQAEQRLKSLKKDFYLTTSISKITVTSWTV